MNGCDVPDKVTNGVVLVLLQQLLNDVFHGGCQVLVLLDRVEDDRVLGRRPLGEGQGMPLRPGREPLRAGLTGSPSRLWLRKRGARPPRPQGFTPSQRIALCPDESTWPFAAPPADRRYPAMFVPRARDELLGTVPRRFEQFLTL